MQKLLHHTKIGRLHSFSLISSPREPIPRKLRTRTRAAWSTRSRAIGLKARTLPLTRITLWKTGFLIGIPWFLFTKIHHWRPLRSWTDSQLKSFLDKNNIPAPQPRKRDTLIAAARSNYESIAKKLGQSFHYPGDWLYETWSESDLKEFLDERGVPVPQPSTRDKLVASVRRNSRLASTNLKDTAASASKSAQAAKESLTDALLDSWSDSKIKEWADKNGIKVPQGSKRNELLALARKHRNALTGDNAASSVSSAFGAATTKANNEFARATDDAQLKGEDAFNQAIGTWSDSRLKAFLDARGVPVPQNGKTDELVKQVRLNKHKASTGWSAWTFDTWTVDNLKWVLWCGCVWDYLISNH